MTECQKRGHRVIKMICEECGQEVNRATFKAPNEWISVRISLPEREKKVLGINQFFEMMVCYLDKPWGSEPETWWVGTSSVFYPTHWMPLPAAPKEE